MTETDSPRCPRCKKTTRESGARFCAHCGATLRGLDPGTVPAGGFGGGGRGPEPLTGGAEGRGAEGEGEGRSGMAPGDLAPGEHVFGHFAIEERLGEGGMGVVYRAVDEWLGSPVALKVLHPRMAADPEARERLRWEVELARSLRHDHVVAVFGYHQDEAAVGFDMKLLPGATLEDHLAGKVEGSPFAGEPTIDRLGWVAALAGQLAGALDYIHRTRTPDESGSRRLVHRDVTPANVMLGPISAGAEPADLHATLMDFGIAHAVGGDRFTVAGIAGRLGYIAPELQLPGTEPTPAADLWSYGLLLYQALTGQQAFVSWNMPGPSAFVRGLPSVVDNGVLSCLGAAGTRPGSAALVADALRAAAEECGETSRRVREAAERREREANERVERVAAERAERMAREQRLQALRDRAGLVRIEPGSFRMGSPEDEEGRGGDETLHEVRITRPFELGRMPVTQALWTPVTGTNPSQFVGEERPVEGVSWLDAVAFCNSLSLDAGLRPAYRIDGSKVTWDRDADGIRLPTEAEWEYAARACGRHRYSGSDDLTAVAWCFKNSSGRTHRVARKEPNAWALHDMTGNVWEWCWDRYGPYPEQATVDPAGPDFGSFRIFRGGSWTYGEERDLRLAARDKSVPATRGNHLGLRLARTLI